MSIKFFSKLAETAVREDFFRGGTIRTLPARAVMKKREFGAVWLQLVVEVWYNGHVMLRQ